MKNCLINWEMSVDKNNDFLEFFSLLSNNYTNKYFFFGLQQIGVLILKSYSNIKCKI
jgi:hypothetical protein